MKKGFLSVAVLLIVCAVGFGLNIPTRNEPFYLLRLLRQVNPQFLLNDWTYTPVAPEHFLFNFIFGFPCRFLPLEIVGLGGRLLCWGAISVGLLRLARHLGLAAWAAVFAITAWIAIGQSLVAGEWMLGDFEAKCVAYACLLFCLDKFIAGSPLTAAFLVGLTFSFHPAVGMWAALGLVPAVLYLRLSIRTLLSCAGLALLGALPGVLALAPSLFGHPDASSEIWEYIVKVRMPFHLDPLSWPKRDILILYLAYGYNLAHALYARKNRASGFLIVFESALCLFFTFGIALRLAEHYPSLKYMPFRLFAVMTPIFFLFRALADLMEKEIMDFPKTIRIALACLVLMSLPGPISSYWDKTHDQDFWARDLDGLHPSLAWLKQNTPNGSIVVLPPWRRDAWYLSERAQVASYQFPQYDRLEEWRNRVEAMVGTVKPGPEEGKVVEMEKHYDALSDSAVQSIAEKYGARYFVTRGKYAFPLLFSDRYNIYAIGPAPDRK